jgi:cytosine/adenosine deaminase-related metal-dependent hydrolase
VQFLDESGFLDARILAVHGVQMTDADLARLSTRGATLVTCPRSNGHTGAGAPPIEDFYTSGVRIAVGTDSLASAPDLNVFAELATMRALAPSVPARRLLDSATRQGARALGFEGDYGTIEPGKSARLLAVEIPADAGDVEEYLVSGIRPHQIRWLEDVER